MIFALILLATIAAHRIWHYEDIFAPVRSSLGAKVLIDPTITPIWIAALCAAVALIQHPLAVSALASLATYPFLRGAVWVYQKYDPPASGATCSPCVAKSQKMMALQKELRTWEKRVILIGADFQQARALADKHPTWLIITLAHIGTAKTDIFTKNMMYHPVITGDVSQTMNGLMSLVFNGGNCTIVTFNLLTNSLFWTDAVRRISQMKAIAWVHVTRDDPKLPEHHRTIAPGEPLDTVIATTLPRT